MHGVGQCNVSQKGNNNAQVRQWCTESAKASVLLES